MITTYFDDSGDKDIAVVAGYVSSVKRWDEFNSAWAKFLSSHGIKQMHRSDLENFRSEFEGWTPDQRNRFVSQ
jgi:hypothetical protein